MTPEHLIFIPSIFLMGFVAGAMLTPYAMTIRRKLQLKEQMTDYEEEKPQRFSGRIVLGALVVFIIMFIATHMFSLPYSMVALKEITGGLPLFDQRPSFSATEVYDRLVQFGPEARSIYLRSSIPLT